MPKYYCEYCNVVLTHDSRSARKGHNAGKNHLMCVRKYYEELGEDKAQAIVNEITRQYEKANAVIPPQYNGKFVPQFKPPQLFSGASYLNPPPALPLFGNMSTGHLNRPPRPRPRPPPDHHSLQPLTHLPLFHQLLHRID